MPTVSPNAIPTRKGLARLAASAAAALLLTLPSVAAATFQHAFGPFGGGGTPPSELPGDLGARQLDFFAAIQDHIERIQELTPSERGPFQSPDRDDDPPYGGLFGSDRLRERGHFISHALFEHFGHRAGNPNTQVPEPDTGLLVAGGLLAVALRRRAHRSRRVRTR